MLDVRTAVKPASQLPRPERGAAVPGPDTPVEIALPWLLDRHGPRLYRLALRLCRNADDAADMVQDVFLQVHRKWNTFRGGANPGTWLYSIASRSCKARMRRKGGTDRRMPAMSQLVPWRESTNADLPDSFESGAATPVAESIRRESARAVHDAILTLPEHFRLPLLLKEMIELPIEDVAVALGLKPQTVKTRLHRARLLMRKVILARLPQHEATAPIYEKQVCIDLLKAKLDAMDHGRHFPVDGDVICARCRAVFAELDLAQDTCAHMADGVLPERLRRGILRVIHSLDDTKTRPSRARAPSPKGLARARP